MGAYPENNDSDSGTKGDDVVERHVLVFAFNDTSSDKVAPVSSNGPRTK